MNNLYYMGLYGGDEYYRSTCFHDYIENRKDTIFYGENEGFIKGNVQKNTYSPYKNYVPTMPIVNSDKEKMLLEIQKYGFYLLDLGLYLDLHPNDKEALEYFKENRNKYYKLINEFNKNYYPLIFMDSSSMDSYQWLQGSFPWVRGN